MKKILVITILTFLWTLSANASEKKFLLCKDKSLVPEKMPGLDFKNSFFPKDGGTLTIKYKGKNISEVLDMTVEQATVFFEAVPKIKKKLDTLNEVGLGYLRLGQPATTLSGGEAQRVKLAKELSKTSTGKTIYLLDEPTTGLHFHDVQLLMDVLHKLNSQGNTIVVIEHNLDVIRNSDWIIDIGPEGGNDGGEIVAAGNTSQLAKCKKSYTGKFL